MAAHRKKKTTTKTTQADLAVAGSAKMTDFGK